MNPPGIDYAQNKFWPSTPLERGGTPQEFLEGGFWPDAVPPVKYLFRFGIGSVLGLGSVGFAKILYETYLDD